MEVDSSGSYLAAARLRPATARLCRRRVGEVIAAASDLVASGPEENPGKGWGLAVHLPQSAGWSTTARSVAVQERRHRHPVSAGSCSANRATNSSPSWLTA